MQPSNNAHLAEIVGTGYFPEELPGCFNSIALKDYIKESGFDNTAFIKLKDKKRTEKSVPVSSKLTPFSIPHIKGNRRELSIPGPYHYLELCQCLIENKKEINKIHKRSKFSFYKDHTPGTSHRYIAKPNYKNLFRERVLRSQGYRYLLNVDIARFYPSIYTHSIPWAIHGKKEAKSNQTGNFYGNQIDRFARNCQDRQTVGLPIGPDSSRIISEIILAKIDGELKKQLKDFDGVRNVDDYFLFFKSYEMALKGKTVLQNLLRSYELELNISKERIIELPDIFESAWKLKIRKFQFRSEKLQQTDLFEFFDLSFQLASENLNEMVLPYAVAKLRNVKISKYCVDIFHAFLLNAMILQSKVVAMTVGLFLQQFEEKPKYFMENEDLKAGFDSFIEFHAQHDHHFEIVWSLWFYFNVGYTLSTELVTILNKSENDFVILLLLSLENKGLVESKFDKSEWKNFNSGENLFTEHWLFAYEANRNWPKDFESVTDNNNFFSVLKSEGVSFFDTSIKNVEDPRVDAPGSSLAKEMEA